MKKGAKMAGWHKYRLRADDMTTHAICTPAGVRGSSTTLQLLEIEISQKNER